jgi:hypothetical protein
MNLSNIRESELKDVFDAMEEAFNATGTDYYIIGALAKDIWYSKGQSNRNFRYEKVTEMPYFQRSKPHYHL